MGKHGHEVKEVHNIPSTNRWENKGRQQDIGASFEGLKSKAFK